jgi:hypothetical protein
MTSTTPQLSFRNSLLLVGAATVSLAACGSVNANQGQEKEIAEALAACPQNVAPKAGVLVLGPKGYVKIRESQNGFNAMVHNTLPNSFEPQCIDAEGSRTRLPVYLREAELTAQGKKREEIDRAIAEGYANGTFRAPGRAGIDWMLSPKNVVPTGRGGAAPYRPHLMIYVPYLTNADLGTELNPIGQAFVVQEGTPGAVLIVPVIPEAASVRGAPDVR